MPLDAGRVRKVHRSFFRQLVTGRRSKDRVLIYISAALAKHFSSPDVSNPLRGDLFRAVLSLGSCFGNLAKEVGPRSSEFIREDKPAEASLQYHKLEREGRFCD